MSASEEITVISRNYDLTIKRTWKAKLVRDESPLIELIGEFDQDVEHSNLGLISYGTVSYEYYWIDRWYNIFRFQEAKGKLRNYYCNIAMPPTLRNRTLDYVDLDVDILVWPDRSFEILDLDEFQENSVRFGYSDAIRTSVHELVSELTEMLQSDTFPFSF